MARGIAWYLSLVALGVALFLERGGGLGERHTGDGRKILFAKPRPVVVQPAALLIGAYIQAEDAMTIEIDGTVSSI